MTYQSQASPERAKYKNENGICSKFGGYANAMRRDIAKKTFYVEDPVGQKAIVSIRVVGGRKY